jgi:hypothetical protein
MRFSSFLDKKNREVKSQLSVIRDVLKEANFKVEDFLCDESPYLFLQNTEEGLDFEGVRIYKVGSNIAYRIQKENKTAPYGAAYSLNIEDMFEDLITDVDEDKIAEQIKKAIKEEFNNFFKKSLKAQEEINSSSVDPLSKALVGGSHGDLSNTM